MKPLRRLGCPPLGWLGRHSLGRYLLHQPVIFGVMTVVLSLPQLLLAGKVKNLQKSLDKTGKM